MDGKWQNDAVLDNKYLQAQVPVGAYLVLYIKERRC